VAADEAGCFAMVIEGVAEDLAVQITRQVSCPTVGIGASASCDGQILVTDDLLGMFDWTPRFVRRYADLRSEIGKAVDGYASDVRARAFPGEKETYSLKKQP
ncbi:MAG TPA: 3-methyl-2-oxobutanoate hydroxymethyltransferase, partial [Hyphomonadaceae bacterium]|nr:3-methyl-2-oxobutanoate hydroxymethyltransferase [Hyphomonadaceae bacterium]